jgi:hypothetical protein
VQRWELAWRQLPSNFSRPVDQCMRNDLSERGKYTITTLKSCPRLDCNAVIKVVFPLRFVYACYTKREIRATFVLLASLTAIQNSSILFQPIFFSAAGLSWWGIFCFPACDYG